jgi:dTDP-L-rhamnose 4-epimerase
MKNILITGGAGFIGSKLALRLMEKDYNVTILDNLSPQIHKDKASVLENIDSNIRFIQGDVRNREDWLKGLKGQDAVVHLAAETGTGQSMYEIEKYSAVNIQGTALLLDILANTEHSIKKMIVASSRSIYGEGKYNCASHGDVYPGARDDKDMASGDFGVKCPMCNSDVKMLFTDEESRIHPSSLYGITKQVQEQMFITMGAALGVPSVAFRYQNVYGPGQSLSNPYTGILSIFSTRIRNGNSISIFEDGLESRDFVYIDDVVDATILGLEKDEANYNVFNVGSGEATSVLGVVNTLIEKYGIDVDVQVTGNYRLGDIRHNIADLTKISNTLGYQPKVSFSEGVGHFTKWVLGQDVDSDDYDRSIQELKDKGLFK